MRTKPVKVVSGGAIGIDSMAVAIARSMGIPYEVFLPKEKSWEGGFKPRNILIAQACDKLLRVVAKSSTTYGSGWTRDYAAGLGKETWEREVEDENLRSMYL